MRVNCFFLSLILSFGIVLCNDSGNIQKLKKAQAEKIAELAALNKMIAEKEDLIDSLTSKINDICKEMFDEIKDKNIADNFAREIKKYEETIYETCLTEKDTSDFLKKNFFFLSSRSANDRITRVKFSFIRRKIEYTTLEQLFDRYQKCLEELLKINFQLKECEI